MPQSLKALIVGAVEACADLDLASTVVPVGTVVAGSH